MRTLLLTALAMAAFAGNSLLCCRLALKETGIDAASFSAIRLVSGALLLWAALPWWCCKSAPRPRWRPAGKRRRTKIAG